MDVTWIETTADLSAWLERAEGAPLAVDTEADSFHHYREKVCLIQLSASGRHALVDPLAAVEVRTLGPALEDPSRRKLLHGADYDIRLLQRDFGIGVRSLFDTSVAARLTGETALGLAALVEKHLGVVLDKSHQRADWSRRPLGPAMRDYAVADTAHLEALAAILEANARSLGRDAWVEEECARLEAVRWRDRRLEDPEPFRRVKGSATLDAAGLAVLREIWGWREEMARRRDRPVFRVLRDEVLLAIAKKPPANVSDLAGLAGFPDYLLRSPAAVALVDAARRGIAVEEADRPQPQASARVRTDPAVEAIADGIKKARDAAAGELTLDPSILASRAVIEDMATRIHAGEDPFGASELRSWQAALLRPRLG
jgi:ribonuclease D